ncbi:MAG: glycosyltransferase family 4 protein [Raineya sp.]|nr:glycosyltransferase family 4 protein [Raineya sp.]
MKILWLTENYPPMRGGMAQSCDRIVFNLRKNGLEIHLLHLNSHTVSPKINQTQCGNDIFFPLSDDLAHTFHLLRHFLNSYLQHTTCTHIVSFGGYASMFLAPLFSKILNLPLITFLRGNDFDAGLFSPRRKDLVEECLLQSVLICSVSMDKVHLIEKLYPHLRVIYTPNGIDVSQWHALPSDLEHAQNWRKTHVKSGKRVVGLFGHLKEKKGALFFLETILRADLQDNLHLLIVGELQSEMKDFLVAENTLAYTHYEFIDRYALLGFYPACDVVAVPSFYDGMPNVLLEAMALGIPIIASCVGGMADVLRNTTNFLFEPNSFEDCAEKLNLFLQTEVEELQKIGSANYELVRDFYTESKEVENYLKAFQSLIT